MSTLVAARVDPARIEEVAACAASFAEVTHNYEREGSYNLWFTVIAENDDCLNSIVREVADCDGVHDIHSLPAIRTFKLRVDFGFEKADDAA